MEFGLFQKQATHLVMTKELQQAIHLLQHSTVELTAFIHEQALENPLIELTENSPSKEEFFDTDRYKRKGQRTDVSPIDYTASKKVSLDDFLLEQLGGLVLPDMWEQTIRYFIFSLNECGYLTRSLEEICTELNLSIEEGERLLHIFQTFDPAGVGARSLQECLLLQLQRLPKRCYLAEHIVRDYINELADKKWKVISKELQVTMTEIQDVHDTIQTLIPKPGMRYNEEPVQYITPDLSIILKDEELTVVPHDHQLPTVHVNSYYERLLREQKNEDATQYVNEKYQQVQWLLKSIEQRKQTILKVTKMIAAHQREFFQSKDGALKPLTLREVAEEIDMHESTVSRATSNKYVNTPRGVFELKAFFSSGIQNERGEATSSKAIKTIVKKLVDKEDKKKPLSDQKMVDILERDECITVSRRAIAKYRDELGIPASSKRKRYV